MGCEPFERGKRGVQARTLRAADRRRGYFGEAVW
jgi:hypothetical protein